MEERLKVKEYDLEYSFYPSFTLVLFERVKRYHYVKAFGHFKGIEILQVNDTLIVKYRDSVGLDVILYYTGLWLDPFEYLKYVSGGTENKLHPILQEYSKVRIPIEPFDRWMIFIATFLSRNTAYYTNVVRWCRELFKELSEPSKVLTYDVSNVGRSFQLLQLKDAYGAYYENVLWKEGKYTVAALKRELLKIKFVGPKVASAYMLFTRTCSWITPVDVHYINFVRRLGLLEGGLKPPIKSYCSAFYGRCKKCPKSDECVEYKSVTKFRHLSGWLQTVSYVHDTLYCNKRLCASCKLKDICIDFK